MKKFGIQNRKALQHRTPSLYKRLNDQPGQGADNMKSNGTILANHTDIIGFLD